MNIKTITTVNYGTNCYLIENESSALIIDPGEVLPEIVEFAKKNKDKQNKFILLTHCHFDHIEGVESVKSIWDAPVVISEKEKEGLIDEKINLSGIWSKEKVSINPDITVSDGDVLKVGKDDCKVISTPGHTKGSVCYMFGDILFSGDTLFRRGIGRTDLPTGDFQMLLKSLRTLSQLDESTIVFSGHGPQTEIGYELEHNPYMKLH